MLAHTASRNMAPATPTWTLAAVQPVRNTGVRAAFSSYLAMLTGCWGLWKNTAPLPFTMDEINRRNRPGGRALYASNLSCTCTCTMYLPTCQDPGQSYVGRQST